jgi:hypothetical protein
MVPPLPFMIYNDRDAVILDQQSMIAKPTHNARKANEITIHLSGTTAFTEKGARKIAKWIRELDERPMIVRIQITASMLDFAFVANVVTIMYLQGNKPELYVVDDINHGDRDDFNLRCRELQQNHESLKECTFDQSFGKAASIQFGVSLHGNTTLQTLTLQIDRGLMLDQAHVLAAGVCNSN